MGFVDTFQPSLPLRKADGIFWAATFDLLDYPLLDLYFKSGIFFYESDFS